LPLSLFLYVFDSGIGYCQSLYSSRRELTKRMRATTLSGYAPRSHDVIALCLRLLWEFPTSSSTVSMMLSAEALALLRECLLLFFSGIPKQHRKMARVAGAINANRPTPKRPPQWVPLKPLSEPGRCGASRRKIGIWVPRARLLDLAALG